MQREKRKFERLLNRTQDLTLKSDIKENLIMIEKSLENLRKSKQISKDDEKKYHQTIKSINEKIQTKRKPRIKAFTVGDKPIDLEKEKQTQEQLKDELVLISGQLKDKVTDIAIAAREDAEKLENVHKNMDKAVSKAETGQNMLEDTSKDFLGFKPYKWLATVVIVYIVVNFVFN